MTGGLPVVQGVAPTEANLLAAVEAWVNAWQSQDLDGYFSAYHTDFAPLYQSTRAAWRDNRVRSIQRPEHGARSRALSLSRKAVVPACPVPRAAAAAA